MTPRQRAQLLPAFKKKKSLCAYDGECELNNLRAIEMKSEIQRDFLDWAEEETWKRPALPLKGSDGVMHEDDMSAPRTSVCSKPLSAFAMSRYPKYRQIRILREEPQESDALKITMWQKMFSKDVHELI